MIRGLSDSTSRNQPSQAKDMVVCPEILKSIEDFKKFLIEQKKIREDLVSTSFGLLQNLKTDLDSVNNQVSIAVTNLRKISTSAARLKGDVLKEEQNASLANKSSEHIITDNANLPSYFLKKLGQFETRMRLYKDELEAFEENVYSQSYTSLTSRHLLNVLTKMDHDFVDVAAQLYTVLESVKVLKAQYLKKYKAIHGPNRNPFGDSDELKPHTFDDQMSSSSLGESKKGISSSAPYGPSPFSTTTDTNATNLIGLTSPDKQNLSNKLPTIGLAAAAAPASNITTAITNTMVTTPALGLGITSSNPSMGLSFGQPSNQSVTIGMPTATAATAGTTASLSFGFSLPTTKTTTTSGFTFGTTKPTSTLVSTTTTPQLTGFPSSTTTSLFKPAFGF